MFNNRKKHHEGQLRMYIYKDTNYKGLFCFQVYLELFLLSFDQLVSIYRRPR